MLKITRIICLALTFFCLVIATVVGALAIYYSNLPMVLRPVAAGIFAVVAIGLIVFGLRQGRRWLWGVFLFLLGIMTTAWWLLIPPSNNRSWQPDVTILPWAEVSENTATVHNIRNVEYRTETDYTVRHYDRSFDLTTLQSLDLFLVYWGSPSIAHTMLSFGFANGSYLSFSIETRKEVGEEYSAVKGFFKQFELTYVVADERDIVRLRTNYRQGEDVYLYRLDVPMDFARKVLLDYLKEINSLKDHPEWYRAIFTNCTTSILRHTTPFNPNPRFDWRFIVNGYLDEMLYERGLIDKSLPFAELKERSLINRQARLADQADDFSHLIRAGLPAMEP
ncbi:lipoprotein N-acyltransferase Lnb domain-containing protein [Desulfopila aestuarii]|uniref:Lnb N-terminal periplasmic domain-containing protein n=1 Tax=Desulfopila aestuarii DSM 18488 TaxID=1121416 RepID=A0A1M7XVM6_9BACT|nr:DUF4105 domain-containing protein [Desulfopila aestuarii]SHO42653.1 protein of unknown function [Desulfopila aestuarii DSM 18488]